MAEKNKTKSSKTPAAAKKPAGKKATKQTATSKATAKAAARPKSKAKKEKLISPEEKYTMIATRAYFKWESAGYPEGDDYMHWIEAEREVSKMLGM